MVYRCLYMIYNVGNKLFSIATESAELPEGDQWWISSLGPSRGPGPRSSHRSRWWRCPWEIALHLRIAYTWGQDEHPRGTPAFFGEKKVHPQPLLPRVIATGLCQ